VSPGSRPEFLTSSAEAVVQARRCTGPPWLVILGRFLVARTARQGLMVSTANRPATTATLSPLMYSLDVFLPVIDLHQEDQWWPDAILKQARRLRAYLWCQILLGWILSAIFLAGVTGLIGKV
jgi:hypothetical protein